MDNKEWEDYPWDFKRRRGLSTIYECQRCGRLVFSTDECHEHRTALFLSPCERRQIAGWLASLFK